MRLLPNLIMILAIGWLPAGHSNARAAISSRATASVSETVNKNTLVLSSDDEALIASMPLKTKIGQMLMVGFVGQTADYALEKQIRKIRPGAIVVFGRNVKSPKQISDLNRAAQKTAMEVSKVPLLVAVDQEGGNVVRIKTAYSLPSALALGQAQDGALLKRAGEATGDLLKTLGFNMNLAPVLDVGNKKAAQFIGTRSYSHEPKKVAEYGGKFADGLISSGIIPTAKHFPGHGGVDEDSHLRTPEKKGTLAQIEKHDLVPFAKIAKSNQHWAIMMAHVSYPGIDKSGMPATFSKPIITDLLRKKLGFNGLVITDDIEMAGASVVSESSERAIRAVEAGVDLIMIAWNRKMQTKVAAALERAVKSGRISEARIDESLRRILRVKRAYVNPSNEIPASTEIQRVVRNPEFKAVAESAIAARFKRKPSAVEKAFVEYASEKPLIVFSASQRFLKEFKTATGGDVEVRTFHLSGNPNFDIDRVMRSNPTAVGIVHVSGSSSAKFAAGVGSDVAARTLLVTTEPPGALPNVENFKLIADVYSRHPDLGKYIADEYFVAGPNLAARKPSSSKK